MWVPLLGVIVIVPAHIVLWALPLETRDIFLLSLPLPIVYLAAFLWQVRK